MDSSRANMIALLLGRPISLVSDSGLDTGQRPLAPALLVKGGEQLGIPSSRACQGEETLSASSE